MQYVNVQFQSNVCNSRKTQSGGSLLGLNRIYPVFSKQGA